MGSLQLKNLENTGKIETGYTYVDLALDIEEKFVPAKFTSNNLPGKDIKVDYDIDAINNSLRNIFSTRPGERFLVPEFGVGLHRYLFSPVSTAIGDRIGLEIVRAIERWEPRVVVDIVNVVGRPEQHEYEVTISLIVIALKKKFDVNMILNQNTDIVIKNSGRVCPV